MWKALASEGRGANVGSCNINKGAAIFFDECDSNASYHTNGKLRYWNP